MAIEITSDAMMSDFKKVYDELMLGDSAQQAIAASMLPLLQAYTAKVANPADAGFKSWEDLQVFSTGINIVGANVGYTPTDDGTPALRPWVPTA